MIIGEDTRRLVLVSATYAALTFVMAYPFSLSPASEVLADNPDTHLYLWTLAWDTHAFTHQPLRIFDANIYHPYANTLAYSENLIGSAFFAAPIIWITGDMVLAMNLVALLTCVLCGIGGYVLGRRLQLSPPASFLCGLVYAFCPPRFFKMGQLHMTAVQWLPFTLAFLITYLDGGRRRHLLLAVGCFTLQVLSSGHGGAFAAIAVVWLLVWRAAFGQPIAAGRWARDFGAAGVALLLPSILVILPYRLAQQQAGLQRGYDASAIPDVTSWLASPSRVHLFLQRQWLGGVRNDEAIAFLFPGILVLVLAAVAIATWRPRTRDHWRRDAVGFFAALGAISTLMFAAWPIELWRHLYWWPGFNFIRAPARFVLVVVMCLAVLTAAAFDRVTPRWSPWARIAASLVLAALLLGEFSGYPFAGVPYRLDVPAVDRWLATQPQPFTVAEVPVPSPGNWGAHERMQTQAMLHATAHWQKTIHGYSGIRRPLHDRVYLELTAFPDTRSIASLRELGVTYIVVHTNEYAGDRWRAVESRLAQFPELQLIHSDGPGRVYALRPIPSGVSDAIRR